MEENLISQLVIANGWNFDAFDKLEELLGAELSQKRGILDEKLSEIDFRMDDYHYNFTFTVKRVLKYASKKNSCISYIRV